VKTPASDDPLLPPGAGIIFDMDGLMLDTEAVARLAWQHAVRADGRDLPDTVFAAMIGRPDRESIGVLRNAFGPAFDLRRAKLACDVFFDEHVARHGVPLKPGVVELLADLSARQIPLAVATSTSHARARRQLEQVGLDRYFSVLVGGDEIARGKPAPDIYLEAIRRLGIHPASSFALEDSPAGVRAAHAAGLNVLMVPDLVPATAEIAALAHSVLPSLHEAKIFFLTRPRA
jgi:HAD superfamily hydrolase (TIGR01509 family)